jgi:glycosyltransferase involved in cell wall biosynthesis
MKPDNKVQPKGCALIPAYLEERRIGSVVRSVLRYIQPVIVIDDGSPDQTAAEASAAGAQVIRHEKNLGKGAALNTGFSYAAVRQFDYVITLDADGQHAPSDIPRFIEAFRHSGVPVLVGSRMADPRGMPLVRKLTNYLMSWYLSREMGQCVPDTQSGFRLYASQALPYLATESQKFAAESETLLRLAVNGIKIGSVPITVIYENERSKISPFRDSIRFFTMIRNFRRMIKRQKSAG